MSLKIYLQKNSQEKKPLKGYIQKHFAPLCIYSLSVTQQQKHPCEQEAGFGSEH